MLASILDAVVDGMMPSNVRSVVALRRRLRPFIKSSLSYFRRRNLLLSFCVAGTILAVLLFGAYLTAGRHVFSQQAASLHLPADLIVGKRDTTRHMPSLIGPGVDIPYFRAEEIALVEQQLTTRGELTVGLKQLVEVNGRLVEGFILPSDSNLARRFAVEAEETVLLVAEPAPEIVTVEYRVRAIQASHVTSTRSIGSDYCYAGNYLLFIPGGPIAVNHVFVDCDSSQLARQRIAQVLRPSPNSNLGLVRWFNPYYFVYADMGNHILASARMARDSSYTQLLQLLLLLGVLIIYNLLLVSYFERQREVGILKALGFTSREVFVLLQGEVLLCTLRGMILALGLGSLFSLAVARYYSFNLISVRSLVVFVGMLALFYVGSVLPAGLLRDASVTSLLRGQALQKD